MQSSKKYKNIIEKENKYCKIQVNTVWEYFENNHLGCYELWKHQKSAYNIWVLFDKIETFEYSEMIVEFRKIRKDLVRMHNVCKQLEHDNRSGIETYGYESVESNIGNLQYISDRWNCQFRLRWIIDLIDWNGQQS
jgi:hypothetical protein